MSHQIEEDWDLCWYYQSETGCKNSTCTWRHANLSGRLYQNHKQIKHNRNYYREDRRKKPSAPFYPVRQHKDGGIEDQYGLVHYPEVEKDSRAKKRFELLGKLLHKLESGYYLSCSSPMSESSPDKTSGPNSSPTSMITSQGGSDSEGDISKNAWAVPARELAKARKRNTCAFSQDLLAEFQRSKSQSKMKCYPDSKTENSLSALAKIFVPRV